VREFGRTIALWRFIALQQFLADIDDDFSWSVATAAVAMMRIRNCPAKSYYASSYPRSGFSTNRQCAHLKHWWKLNGSGRFTGNAEVTPKMRLCPD
jgi:homoserine acetyltransferase